VETRLVARLAGIRLLRVDGTVVLAPGRVLSARDAVGEPGPLSGPVPVRQAPSSSDGHALAEAARLLADSRRRLQHASELRRALAAPAPTKAGPVDGGTGAGT
jgi:hypothetical protein